MNNRAEIISLKQAYKLLFIRENYIVHETIVYSIHQAAALAQMWEEQSLTLEDLKYDERN
jgi:hypothetical protein